MSLTKKVWEGMWTGTTAAVIENLLRMPRMIITTRLLGPELYGILGVCGVFRDFLGPIIQLGTGDAIIKFLAADNASKDYSHAGAVMRAAGIVRFVMASLIVLIYFLYEKELIAQLATFQAVQNVPLGELFWLGRLLLAGILINAAEGPLGNALSGFQAWRALLVIRIINAIASNALPILAALMGFRLLGIVFSQQISFAILALAITWYFFKIVFPRLQRVKTLTVIATIPPVMKFGLPLIFSQLLYVIQTNTNQIMMVGMNLSANEISYFEVARNIAAMLVFLPNIIRTVMFPAASEFFIDKNIRRLEALFTFMVKNLFWLLLPCAAWTSVLAPFIVEIVSGAQYAPASKALHWLAMASIMRAFAVPFYTCLVGALGQTKKQFYISLVSVMLNIGLSYSLIPVFGYMGTAYTSVISSVVGFILAVIFLSPYMKLNFPARRMLTCMFLVSVTCIILYGGYVTSKILIIPLIPVVASLYIYGIIRLGYFDKQDIDYLNRLFSPVMKRFPFLQKFLERYAIPIREHERLT